jgi:hypothetical protein
MNDFGLLQKKEKGVCSFWTLLPPPSSVRRRVLCGFSSLSEGLNLSVPACFPKQLPTSR